MIKTRLPLFVRPYIHASSIVILVLVLLAGQGLAGTQRHCQKKGPAENRNAHCGQAARQGDARPVKKVKTIAAGDVFSEILKREGVSMADALAVARKVNRAYRLTRMRPGTELELYFTHDGSGLQEIDYKLSSRERLVLYNGRVVKLQKRPAGASFDQAADRISPAPPAEARDDGARRRSHAQERCHPCVSDMRVVASYDPCSIQSMRHPAQLPYELLAQGKVLSPITPPWTTYVRTSMEDHSRTLDRPSLPNARNKKLALKSTRPRARREEGFLRAPLTYRYISSGFTSRRLHPVFNTVQPHYGVDFAAPMGTPVHAVGAGKVIFLGWDGGFGKVIRILHPNGYITHYGHLCRYETGIRPGKTVKRGQKIGYVGMTGVATGPHLDFRVTCHGNYINPLQLQKHSKKVSGCRNRKGRG
jgi:hypothetical protein